MAALLLLICKSAHLDMPVVSKLCVKCSRHADHGSHVYKPSSNVAFLALLSHRFTSRAVQFIVHNAHNFAASQGEVVPG